MNKTRIEWADYTWNPIKGLCPVGCWYCYSHKIYKRFGMNPKVILSVNELIKPFPKKPSKIFLCSTFELFHPIADKWRDDIFEIINLESQHTFIILTKMPERIDRPMPGNVWLGVSVTGADDWYHVGQLASAKARIKFVSIEPFLGNTPRIQKKDKLNWIIVGRLTGHSNRRDPEYSAIGWIIAQATELEIPLFMKDNLRGIPHCGPLIQEFPK